MTEYSNSEAEVFWSKVSTNKYPKVVDKVMLLMSMFGSTCESVFSDLKIIKSKHRNSVSNEHLEYLLKLGRTNIEVDIGEIIKTSK